VGSFHHGIWRLFQNQRDPRKEIVMEIGIFTFGVFVTALLISGFIFTMNEFRKMGENPENYRDKKSHKDR
jgi:hypothetical protein